LPRVAASWGGVSRGLSARAAASPSRTGRWYPVPSKRSDGEAAPVGRSEQFLPDLALEHASFVASPLLNVGVKLDQQTAQGVIGGVEVRQAQARVTTLGGFEDSLAKGTIADARCGADEEPAQRVVLLDSSLCGAVPLFAQHRQQEPHDADGSLHEC